MSKIKNIRSLIEKINAIDTEKEKEKTEKKLQIIFIYFPMLISCLMLTITDIFKLNIFIVLSFILFYIIVGFIILFSLENLKISNFFANVFCKKYIKSLNKEEINLINFEKNNFLDIVTNKFKNEFFLVKLLDKYIENIETVNIESFLKLYKEINLSRNNFNMLTNKLLDKFVNKNNLVILIYRKFTYLKNIGDLSAAERVIYNFLKENNEFKEKLLKNNIDYILDNTELNDILSIHEYRESLSLKQIILKLKKKYNLKEIVENIFIKVEKNENEIQKIYNLLDIEQKMLFKKEIIEDILELKDENIIENCSKDFLNYSNQLKLKNKDLLCLMNDKIYLKEQ